MGQAQSYNLRDQNQDDPDPWWSPQSEGAHESLHSPNETCQSITEMLQTTPNQNNESTANIEDNQYGSYSRSLDSREKLEIFKKHLEEKRLERQSIISAKKREMDELRTDLEQQKIQNRILSEKLREFTTTSCDSETVLDNIEISNVVQRDSDMDQLRIENELLKSQLQQLSDDKQNTEDVLKKNKELQMEQASLQYELQSLNKQISESEQQKEEYIKHIAALKDIIKISKQMILIREGELKELKRKVALIESTLADREAQIMSNNLREEYERQLQNIRNLRTLYEERSRISRIELQNVKDQLTATQQKLEDETNKSSELEQRIKELENDASQKYDNINNLESNLGLSKAECRGLKHEMAVINQLFAQFLLGFNSPTQDVNLDKLVQLLEENHDLLTDITVNDDSNETALPRLLLHLVNETDKNTENENNENLQQEETSVAAGTNNASKNEDVDTGQGNVPGNQFNSPEEIVTNLPKVWRVLTELLSHQVAQPVEIDESCSTPTTDASNPCYKSVETPGGTRYVLSVSKTYIRLKDLIVEKKYLQKEMFKMKTLNTRLESRLHEQESRLHIVSKELSKTWHIVGRLQRQHEQLHTNEKILCYELRQKRKMLNELKEELELCKGKWKSAREKNKESEHECRKLRTEFASRRSMAILESGNNSAESGYSDEQEELDSEEDDLDETVQNRKELEERFFITSINAKPSEVTCENTNVIIEDENSTEVSSVSEESISEHVPSCSMTNIILPPAVDIENNIDSDQTKKPPFSSSDLCHSRSENNTEIPSASKEDISENLPSDNIADNLSLPPTVDIENNIDSDSLVPSSENSTEVSSVSEESISEDVPSCNITDNIVLPPTIRIENHIDSDQTKETLFSSSELCLPRSENSTEVSPISEESISEQVPSCNITDNNNIESDQISEISLTSIDICHQSNSENCDQSNAIFDEKSISGENLRLKEEMHVHFDDHVVVFNSNLSTNILEQPSTSSENSTPLSRARESIIKSENQAKQREERFKRLEENCQQLKQTYTNQTQKGTDLSIRLDNLHQQFSGDSGSNTPLNKKSNTGDIAILNDENSTPGTSTNINLQTEVTLPIVSPQENIPSTQNEEATPSTSLRPIRNDAVLNKKSNTEDIAISNDENSTPRTSANINSQTEVTLPIVSNQENIPSTQNEEATPCTSLRPIRNDAEREERFKRLEEQCKQLKQKYSKQTKMGTELCSKLDNIHQQFSTGSSSSSSTDNTTDNMVGSNSSITVADNNESETLNIIPNTNMMEQQPDVVESLNNQTTTTNAITNIKSNNDEH